MCICLHNAQNQPVKYSAIKCYMLLLLSLASRSKGLLAGGEEYKTGTDHVSKNKQARDQGDQKFLLWANNNLTVVLRFLYYYLVLVCQLISVNSLTVTL